MSISRRILGIVAGIFFALTATAKAADREAVPELIDGAPSYVRFPPIFTPIIQGDRVTRQVGITLMLQLKKGEEKEGIEDRRLQLNNAFLENLYAFFQQRVDLKGGIDEAYLKQRLLKVADNVIGKDAVQEVLIEQLFEERK
jgi:hypothetical protein